MGFQAPPPKGSVTFSKSIFNQEPSVQIRELVGDISHASLNSDKANMSRLRPCMKELSQLGLSFLVWRGRQHQPLPHRVPVMVHVSHLPSFH